MTYQVLARKWRPRIFRDMAGQGHVLKALINALDNNRLHHAYLFTGTRGVGKTTIGRILAKCLNCDVGVSSNPCDQCNACVAINEGRFVDLIEIDAASKTKVEDTRDLLNNVPYSPASGRYKVYLIDEVHMLSNSSFNALLKTLEEPPSHVKFLLATTDPQKLPATILSRCLKFNLKHISPEKIVGYLQMVLNEESIVFEEAGLWQLARAADGSMRDALSLTDQAIAYSDNKITEKECNAMLGNIDTRITYDLLEALSENDGKRLLSTVASLAEHCSDFTGVLNELLVVLHRVATAQALPDAVDNSLGDQQHILASAKRLTAEDVQLFYQMALLGKRDLPLAPDSRSGLEMVLLRMLNFKVQDINNSRPNSTDIKNITSDSLKTQTEAKKKTDLTALSEPIPETTPELITKLEKVPLSQFTPNHWLAVYSDLTVEGLLQTTVSHCVFNNKDGKQDSVLLFTLDERYSAIYDESHQQRLASLLTDYFAETVQARINIGKITSGQETPAAYATRCQQQQLVEAQNTIANDALVNQLIKQFDAEIVSGSIAPTGN